MRSLVTIIISDYLQRTRSYGFLITLCASLALGYTFVPEPNAPYTTIRISDYVGYYNSAWFGYVTAIMASVFLSLLGFYLVNSGIKKDIQTRIGHIVAATPISNFKYLLAKTLSNFLVLFSILGMILIMSFVLFALYNDGYPFQIMQFIKPYALIAVPTLFVVAVIAVVFEVFLGKYSVLQNVGYFFLFTALIVATPKTEAQFAMDIFGGKFAIHELEQAVRDMPQTGEETVLSVGYVFGRTSEIKRFLFNGIEFPVSFIVSRFAYVLMGIALIALIAPFFHRFNVKERQRIKRTFFSTQNATTVRSIVLSALPKVETNFGILRLVKTELLLLSRKGKKWLWVLNLTGMVLLAALPIEMAHRIVLPILWFLQVSRLSGLGVKEHLNRVHYFSFTAYKPLGRVLTSQLIAGSALMVLLALPLCIRLGFALEGSAMVSVLLGAVFITLCAAVLGILSRGKKLFEVLFFLITYANINGIPYADYFGAFEHPTSYRVVLPLCILILTGSIFRIRKGQLRE